MPAGYQYTSTAPQTALATGISNSALSMQVASATGYPAAPFTVTLDIGNSNEECVNVTNVSGTTFTITRAVDGTPASAHAFNATVTHTIIGRDYREFRAHLDAQSTSPDAQGNPIHGLGAGSQVVGTIDTQTLTNKTLTSPNIGGTVSGGATYSAPTLSNAAITGTPTGTAKLTSWTPEDATFTNDVVGAVPLAVNAIASTTADLLDLSVNGTKLAYADSAGLLHAPALSPTGLTGAVSASRYVGATTGGPPTTGTFAFGDWCLDAVYFCMWVCISAGSPGTWKPIGDATISEQVVAGSAAASIVLPSSGSIPAYWDDLILRFSGQSSDTTATNNEVQLNCAWGGATSGQYLVQRYGANISAGGTFDGAATGNNTTAQIADIWNVHAAGNGAGIVEAIFPNYSRATWTKGVLSRSLASNSAGASGGASHTWNSMNNSTSAITNITLTLTLGSFQIGSYAKLIAQ